MCDRLSKSSPRGLRTRYLYWGVILLTGTDTLRDWRYSVLVIKMLRHLIRDFRALFTRDQRFLRYKPSATPSRLPSPSDHATATTRTHACDHEVVSCHVTLLSGWAAIEGCAGWPASRPPYCHPAAALCTARARCPSQWQSPSCR